MIAVYVLGALLLVAGGIAGGYAYRSLLLPGICSCGHPSGCGTPFGTCTRKIRVRNYVGGKRHGWKYDPCGCRDHGEVPSEVPA